jgi:hypothetical protein
MLIEHFRGFTLSVQCFGIATFPTLLQLRLIVFSFSATLCKFLEQRFIGCNVRKYGRWLIYRFQVREMGARGSVVG